MQQPMPHQLMGYDRAITMFSPDGRLLQVEYAKKTVKQGSTAIGMVCTDGVLLIADKRIVDRFIIPSTVEKIFEIDEHIGATASGILSDARVLIERSQLKSQQHKVTYDTPIDTISVVKDVSSLKQICTQSAGLRPFGVSVIYAGIDTEGPRVFETDPTGIFFQFRISVIGEHDMEIEEYFEKALGNKTVTIEEGLKISAAALNKVLDKSFNADRLDAAFIKTSEKKYTKVPKDKIEKILKEIKSKKK